jgi:predicted transcriptional regulator
MSSNSNNATTLAENKVLILYILNLIDNDFRQDDLFKIISSINDINYFYFKQLLTDLIDSKLVGIYTKEEEQVIRITSEGKNAYILTKDVLPGIMKLKADHIFKKEFPTIEEESSVIAEFTPKSENDYTIKCKIVENNETIFEVKTTAGSRDRAKRIVDNWNKNATNIYPKILNLLLEEN